MSSEYATWKKRQVTGIHFENVTGTSMRCHWAANVHPTNKAGLTSVPADPPEYAGQYPDPNLWGNTPGVGYFIRQADGVSFTNSAGLAQRCAPIDREPRRHGPHLELDK